MKHVLQWAAIFSLLFAVGCKKGEEGKGNTNTDETTKPDEPPKAETVTLKLACGQVAQEQDLCNSAIEAWQQKTGHKVEIVSVPNEADQRLKIYQNSLSAKSDSIDVYLIDVIWPGILANHFVDLKQYSKGTENQHIKGIVQNNTVDGKLLAMPWFTDAGVLYYRKDLLEKHGEKPPTTWDELAATAAKIQAAERKAGNKDMWGYVWQGKAYEGLTCNALEWVVSHGGGSIVESDGSVSIDNEKAVAAIDKAAGWIDTISPKGVLNYAEEESRSVWQLGNAVFMRNWPYAWAKSQADDSKIKDQVGVTALPKGGADGRNAATLGGWQLAVSKYSKNPAVAAELVMYLTSPEEQKRRAIEGSFNPTIPELYKDADVIQKNPFFGYLYDTMVNATPRPSTATGEKYDQVSREFHQAVHTVLSGKAKAKDAMSELADKLDSMSKGGNW